MRGIFTCFVDVAFGEFGTHGRYISSTRTSARKGSSRQLGTRCLSVTVPHIPHTLSRGPCLHPAGAVESPKHRQVNEFKRYATHNGTCSSQHGSCGTCTHVLAQLHQQPAGKTVTNDKELREFIQLKDFKGAGLSIRAKFYALV